MSDGSRAPGGSDGPRRELAGGPDPGRAELVRHLAELRDARRAALNVMEDAIQARDALRESQERLGAVAANLPSGAVFVVGPDLRYTLAAGEALGPAGLSRPGLEGKTVAEVMPPELVAEYEANYGQALRGEPFKIEHTSHGRHYITHGVPLRDGSGAVTAALAVSYDITDRRRAEAALRESEQRYQSLFAASPVPFMVLDANPPDFTITGANDAYLAATLTTREGLIGRRLFDVFTDDASRPGPHGSDALAVSLDRVLATRRTDAMPRVRYDIVAPGGGFEPHWWLAINAPMLDASGRVGAIIHQVSRVTELHLAEEADRQHRERQAFLLGLSDALRPLADPIEIQGEASRLLREHLDAGWCYYNEFDPTGTIATIQRASSRPGLPSVVGVHDLSDVPEFTDYLHSGRIVNAPAFAEFPLFNRRVIEKYAALGMHSVLGVPLVKGGRLIAVLLVADTAPRDWPEAAVGLIAEVAERTWAAVERATAEATLADELRAMTRLHDLSERLMAAMDLPTALGEVLDMTIGLHGADRGTVQFYDSGAEALRYAASRGFDQAVLDSIPSIDRNFHSTCAAAIRAGRRVVAADIAGDPNFAEHAPTAERLGYRSAISTPMMTRFGELQGVLTVHFRAPHHPAARDLRLTDLYVRLAAHLIERARAEAAIRESKDRLQLALSSARMGIWMWDVEGDVHSRDANLNRLLGLEAAETRGPFAEFIAHVHPDDRAFVSSTFHASVRRGRPLNIEFRITRPDGSVRWLRDQGDVFDGVDGHPPHLTGACVDVTDLKEAEEALRRSRDELESRVAERTSELAQANDALREGMTARTELLRRVVTAQEDERRRVARDLHDGLGQELTALILGLGALAQAVPEGTPGRDRLAEVEATVGRIGREAHDLAIDLRPTALDDLGLAPALAAYIDRWAGRVGVVADFQPLGLDGDRLPPEVETTVYRVVQEALNNVAKHAGPRRVSVILERREASLIALVEDDGRGFDPDRPATSGRRGLGLLGMRERLSLVGGTLLIESAPGQGTTLRARIPLGPAPEGRDDGR